MPSYYHRLGVAPGAQSAENQRLSPETLLQKARFKDCLCVLDGDQSPKAILIRMRAMMYLDEHHDLVRADWLERIEALPVNYRAEAYAMIARAYYRADMRAPAENMRLRALRIAESSGDAQALATARYYNALLRFFDGIFDEAEYFVNLVIPDREWGPRAMDLRAWIYGRRGDYAKQLRELQAAYNHFRDEDVWGKAAILHSGSALARELYDPAAAEFFERRAESLDWTEETRVQESHTFRNLAWCCALGGRTLQSGEHFARAEACAPNASHVALVNTDRAYIAFSHGEQKTFQRYLERARYAAEHMDLKRAQESQSILLLLAQMMTQVDVDEATRLLQRYIAISTPISPLISFGNGDNRRLALEQFTAGVVYRARGERADAIESFKQALRIWQEVGYHWRAAQAAYELGEATGRTHYTQMAQTLIKRYTPHAFFARTLESFTQRLDHPDVLALPKARRDVLIAFMDGLKNPEIAERLGVSTQTVKNQMSQIYRAFNVRSSRALHSALKERGIL